MKRILCIIILLVVNVLIYSIPILAEGSGLTDYELKNQKGQKDECLLVAINCGSDFVTLEQKIGKLQKEISKGRAVYTDEELRNLKEKLNNANKTLEYFKYEGARNWYSYPGE